MNYYYLLLGLSSTFCLVSSITIREAVVVGDGSDEDLPVEEGKIKKFREIELYSYLSFTSFYLYSYFR